MSHDFSFASGERQTAATLDGIREDHLARYRVAVRVVKAAGATGDLFGLDAFCGNGYGTRLLHQDLGCPVWGIDGSAEAVTFANTHFGGPDVLFAHKVYPFRLPARRWDFVVCLESIEHVQEDQAFLTEVVGGLKAGGRLILSTPNADKLDTGPHPFHFRHYTRGDVTAMARRHRLELLTWWGQNTYVLDGRRLVGQLPVADMALRERTEGQFQVYAFRKRGRWL